MSEQLHFDVASASIFSLGRELISDGSQAVMELVKNCFDADATFASVEIMGNDGPPPDSHFPDAKGYIRIRDDGDGMTLDQLRRGWFTIALSEKKRLKEQGLETRRGRTPLGDKGLGRLGAQALADNVEITTRPRGSTQEVHAWFSWNEFTSDKPLSSISIRYEIRDATGVNQGTTILLSNLRPIANWSSKDAQIPLQRSLSRLISPFKAISEFRVLVKLNGVLLDLIEGASDIRSHAVTRCVFIFDGTTLDVEYFAKLDYCRSTGGNNKNREDQRIIDELFDAYVERDGGAALLEFMKKRKPSGFEIRSFSGKPGDSWFVCSTRRVQVDDFVGLSSDSDSEKSGRIFFANPGPFEGEIDNFVLDERRAGGVPSDIKGRIKDIGGLRVFRNGFGIQLEDDWLGIGRNITSGRNSYELKLGNILGYVALTAKENARLSETSDRQRFNYDTPYYKNFRAFLLHVLTQMGTFQSVMKEETRKFLRGIDEQRIGVLAVDREKDILTKHRQIEDRIESSAHRLSAIQMSLKKSDSALGVKNSTQSSQMSILPPHHSSTQSVTEAESKAIRAAEMVIADLSNDLKGIADLRRILEERMAAHQRQIELSYETILTGISMEVFAHEIANVADRLMHWSSALASLSAVKASGNGELRKYIDNVKSQSVMIQRQLVYITPAMRFVRDRKDIVSISELLDEVVSYHGERLSRSQIVLNYKVNSPPFKVQMNKGRFHQILDNLILNSEYWVRHWIAKGKISGGLISIAAAGSRVEISDNGPGIDSSLVESIFEPFVSGKPAGEGRGIGLFVVTQLLASQGCTISLLPLLNENGRRFVFSINLQAVINHA